MSPYRTLGVRKNATPEQIAAAYRRKVRKAHPDAGGSADKFQLVQLAYDVLSDPDARRRYDETGEVRPPGKPADYDHEVVSLLRNALVDSLNQCVKNGDPPNAVDLIAAMKTRLKAALLEVNKNVAGVTEGTATLEKCVGRFSDSDDMLNGIVQSEIAQHKAQAENLKKVASLVEKAISYLDGCKYKSDPMTFKVLGPSFIFKPSSSTSTTL